MSNYIKKVTINAQASIVWMHGLGSNAEDMGGLAGQLVLPDLPVNHLFINAPSRPVTLNGGLLMPAWYDIIGLKATDREDKEGIEQSELLIRDAIQSQLDEGFQSSQIFLAGFSQGGAMALHTALHYTERLGGVIALSAYLPLARYTTPLLDKKTPFFLGSGQFDPVVLPAWTAESRDWLLLRGYENLAFHQYPIQHSVCYEEVRDLSLWLKAHIEGKN